MDKEKCKLTKAFQEFMVPLDVSKPHKFVL